MKSLRKSLIEGSAWTMMGVVMGQLIRLGKSLILTRLLFPEAYGLMAIVGAVVFALIMLSDAGLSAAAVRHKRGDEPVFLNTIWTMKVIRGAILFAITCIIAGPLSTYYDKPDLIWILPMGGLGVFADGFSSTNVYSLQRKMTYGRLTLVSLSVDVVGFFVTLIWAHYYPSVAALIGSALVCSIYSAVMTHLMLPGMRNKFQLERAAYKDIFDFGKWILFSSVLYLVYTQGDRFLLGKYLDATLLGVYSIAIMLAEVVTGLVSKLNSSVLFPALSRVINDEREKLAAVFYRTRLGTDLLLVLPSAVLLVIGNDLVRFLYDSRYQEAGWMLQVLAVKLILVAILSGAEMCLLALGHPKFAVIQNACRAVWIIVGIPLGWNYFGIAGAVWVIALTEVPVIFVLWFGMARHQILKPLYEARALLFVGAGVALGFAVKAVLFPH